jgi:LDH2 family malate/lactate/ureidoglycolate dehydrogenase
LVENILVHPDVLRTFVTEVLLRAGVLPRQAQQGAEVLLWASLRGVDTHGIRNLKSMYIDPILAGKVNLEGALRIEHDTPIVARVDGDLALGIAIGCDAMQLAMDKAQQAGVGIVTVRNSQHLGPAGYFAQLAIEQDQIGIALTGEFFAGRKDKGVAPINSLTPLFSSNPLSCAVPCGRHPPYLLDISTSVTSINRVIQRGRLGQDIPLGWVVDATGAGTCDPAAAQIMLPLGGSLELGGHKGVGLAMMVSILTGVLSGGFSTLSADGSGTTDVYRQWSKGHLFAAVRIDQFLPPDQLKAAMDAMIDTIQSAPPISPEEPILYPGAKEQTVYLERSRQGIPLATCDLEDLGALARHFNVALPL